MMSEDEQLLRRYAEEGSEPAFGELVRRHVDLVYSAALRMLNGDSHMAQDVTQTVFADLARKAHGLPRGILLAGWLYRHACFTAANVVRGEQRRKARERIAVEMSMASDESTWKGIAPLLEESMEQLGKKEREAIVLRFFKQMDFRSVAVALEVGEDAAQKRVSRGLEKLRMHLKQRGVVVSSAALAAMLTAEGVSSAPVNLAASVTGTALASAAAGGGVSITSIKLMAMTKLKVATAAVVAGLLAAAVWQYQANGKLRNENRTLAERAAQVEQLRAENARLAAQPKTEPGLNQDQLKELLRLRSEVGRLRKEAAEAAKVEEKKAQTARQEPQQKSAEEQAQLEKYAKLSHSQQWVLTLREFVGDNDGQYPTNFQQVLPYLSDGDPYATAATTNQFEILYKGLNKDIAKPSETMVLREREAWQSPDGAWFKTYGFADGHAELHKAADGNFDAYENEHIQRTEESRAAQ
ncbi:RNA polymerase sigma factor [Pedosphaera parvula]|nr:sigma-70 family RNA polymerase sigma factor [Pedosphaera parvula]